jgi:hypothetical protein
MIFYPNQFCQPRQIPEGTKFFETLSMIGKGSPVNFRIPGEADGDGQES